MNWRSLGGLPGGFGVCRGGIVMLLLSDFGASRSTGGSLTNYSEEVEGR